MNRAAKLMIESGAYLNAKNLNDDTPLHLAVTFNRNDIAIALILEGANLGVKNKSGVKPFEHRPNWW